MTAWWKSAPVRDGVMTLMVIILALTVFLPGFRALPVTDRDEALFATASRQMVQTGDGLHIYFRDEPRLKKPVGIYWLQSAAAVASGQGENAPIWVLRLPSLIAAVLSVALVVCIGIPLFGMPTAVLAAALFSVTLIIGGEARLAKTDAALLATVLIMQAVLARWWMYPPQMRIAGKALPYLFWSGFAASILIKGPIGPLVVFLTMITASALIRSAKWLRPLWTPAAIVTAILIAAPWFVAITLDQGRAFWVGSVGVDLSQKIASGQEGKGAPPGGYLLMAWITLWPVTTALILGATEIWKRRSDMAIRLLAAWIVPFWLLFEAIPTKLIHYPLPVFPALSLLAAGYLHLGLHQSKPWQRIAAAISLFPGLLLGAGLLYVAYRDENARAAIVPAAAGLGMATGAALIALWAIRGKRCWALAIALISMGGFQMAGVFTTLPRLAVLWSGERAFNIGTQWANAKNCHDPLVIGWGYSEPSLTWLGGRSTRLDPASAPTSLPPNRCAIILRAGPRLGDAPTACALIGRARGFSLGAGRWQEIEVLGCSPSSPHPTVP